MLQSLILRLPAALLEMDYETLRLDATIESATSSRFPTLLAIDGVCLCNCKIIFSMFQLLVAVLCWTSCLASLTLVYLSGNAFNQENRFLDVTS